MMQRQRQQHGCCTCCTCCTRLFHVMYQVTTQRGPGWTQACHKSSNTWPRLHPRLPQFLKHMAQPLEGSNLPCSTGMLRRCCLFCPNRCQGLLDYEVIIRPFAAGHEEPLWEVGEVLCLREFDATNVAKVLLTAALPRITGHEVAAPGSFAWSKAAGALLPALSLHEFFKGSLCGVIFVFPRLVIIT